MSDKRQGSFEPRRRSGTAVNKDLEKIQTFLTQYLGFDTRAQIAIYQSKLERLMESEGKLNGLKLAKKWYDCGLRYSAGLKLEPIPFRKSDSVGLPKEIHFLKPLLNGSVDGKRTALTILQLYKLVNLEAPYTLKGITDPYTGQVAPEWLDEFKRLTQITFPKVDLQNRINSLKPGFHISGSNGPNGPSLGSAFVDREVIRGTNLENSIGEISLKTNNYPLYELLVGTRVPAKVNRNGKVPFHSRIRIKYESGAKARPFAIVDFFSQSSLKPIHIYMMDWLKKVKMDGAQEHSDAAFAVKEWTKEPGIKLWSYDLTQATDRFPIFLEEIVVSAMFGSEICRLWKDIISNRTFEGPKGEQIVWKVGQPLGALSSWASFSISHHLLLQTAASLAIGPRKLGKPVLGKSMWFTDYRMIGDDITIARSQPVALKYKELLDTLGVEISIPKSVIPEQCSGYPTAELAKRLFQNGYELTPLPPEAILQSSEPFGLRTLIESSWLRGYRTAGSPFTVQSTPRITAMEWAELTIPFRNRLPQLNGVKLMFPVWNNKSESNLSIAGLHSGWFTWATSPDDEIQDLIRTFIMFELIKAEEETEEILNQIQYKTWIPSKNYFSALPQGGDWKPGPLACHTEILVAVLDEVREVLSNTHETLYSSCLPNIDLWRFIGQLHRFLQPEIMILGRDHKDEKEKTRIFASRLVRYVAKHSLESGKKQISNSLPYSDDYLSSDPYG